MSTTEAGLDGYNTFFDPETCVKKGLCPVSKIQKESEPLQSHSLYYEIHGTGPEKLVFIMGLNGSYFGWKQQVEHFSRIDKYQLLVFDNRGVGNSDTPKGPYTTSGMAEDVITLLDYVEWKRNRDLHIIGISMGGMITLEMATRIPERIASLSLIVTTAGGRVWSNLPTWKGISNLAKLMTVTDPKQKIPLALDMLYPQVYLDSKVTTDPAGRTGYELQAQGYLDRIEITRPQTALGAMSQMAAGLTHRVSVSRLQSIARSIPKILILTGTEDNLVSPENSKWLAKWMQPENDGVEYVVWEGVGHAVPVQVPERFNEIIEKNVKAGRERSVTPR